MDMIYQDPIKVYFEGPDGCEVRKFKLTVCNLAGIRNTLLQLFPTIGSPDNVNIYYEDEDGDLILIGTDEELGFAVNELMDEYLKIYAAPKHIKLEQNMAATAPTSVQPTINPYLGSMNSEGFPTPTGPDSAQPPPLHDRIICDGCNGEIRGFRYQCLQCVNYDLCADCEGLGHHSNHLMIRIPTPVTDSHRMVNQIRTVLHQEEFLESVEPSANETRDEIGRIVDTLSQTSLTSKQNGEKEKETFRPHFIQAPYRPPVYYGGPCYSTPAGYGGPSYSQNWCYGEPPGSWLECPGGLQFAGHSHPPLLFDHFSSQNYENYWLPQNQPATGRSAATRRGRPCRGVVSNRSSTFQHSPDSSVERQWSNEEDGMESDCTTVSFASNTSARSEKNSRSKIKKGTSADSKVKDDERKKVKKVKYPTEQEAYIRNIDKNKELKTKALCIGKNKNGGEEEVKMAKTLADIYSFEGTHTEVQVLAL